MQRFIRDGNAVSYEEMIAWDIRPTRGVQLSLFFVNGDLEEYEEAVDRVDTIDRYHLSKLDNESALVWVVEQVRPEFASFAMAFAGRDVLVLPPVQFDDDAAMRMRAVGPGEAIQGMLTDVREENSLTVHAVGPYHRRLSGLLGQLSQRQRDAVETAHELGYYEVPREADLRTVADALDCSESTASVLLRRAKRRILDVIMDRSHRPTWNDRNP